MSWTLRLTAFLILVRVTSADAQTLKGTTDWLHNFVEANAARYREEANGELSDWKGHLSAKGCEITIQEDGHVEKTLPYRSFHRAMFNLKDMDPSRVEQSVLDDTARISLHATNERPIVRNISKLVFPKSFDDEPVEWENDEFANDHVVTLIGLGDSNAAQRVAKALRHAITLCGGKPSTF